MDYEDGIRLKIEGWRKEMAELNKKKLSLIKNVRRFEKALSILTGVKKVYKRKEKETVEKNG